MNIKSQLDTGFPHCQHLVLRKKRFCRMTIKAGAKYCGEHEEEQVKCNESYDNTQSRSRMPCPLDPKHTCFVSKLSKHLKICNARHTEQPTYIVKGCNYIVKVDQENISKNKKHVTLSTVPVDTLQAVVKKVNDVYALVIEGNIKNLESTEPHRVIKADLESVERGNNTKKHLLQNSALLHLLEKNFLVTENTCFVELGAGKGRLSYFLSQAISEVKTSSVLLVDRQSHRHKQDNKVNKEIHSIHRIKVDICDLNLSKVNVVNKADKLVAVSKHLCGMATDLALKCITNEDLNNKTHGVIMATCCHHRCDFDAFVGKGILKSYDLSSEEFSILCGLVSWATCGSGFSRERRSVMLQNAEDKLDPKRVKIDDSAAHTTQNYNLYDKNYIDIVNSDYGKNKLGLNLSERTEVGRKAKAILDWGRVQFLNENGFHAQLWHFVEPDISPENVCIVATRISNNLQ